MKNNFKRVQDIKVENYMDNIQKPWGKIFYKIVWSQLGELDGKQVLDFGSGLGVTANYLSQNNYVTAIEPNKKMIEIRFSDNDYKQIHGGIYELRQEPDNKYDVIICHNVMEYIDDRHEVLTEFLRVLKPDGFISIVKHNHLGKIMHKIVFDYNVEETIKLLKNETIHSEVFGEIGTYQNDDIIKYSGGQLEIEKNYGVRSFFALQDNKVKSGEDWIDHMFKIETMAAEISEFRDVAFFNHLVVRRKYSN